MVLKMFGQELRYRGPYVQNLLSSLGAAGAAGIYVSLNLLGAGGGRPDAAKVVQVVNATLCAVWFLSASFGGSIMNLLGPGITMCIGVQCYVVYVGSLWYYDAVGSTGYPYASGVIIGIGAGMVFIVAGYISLAYPEEKDKGLYVSTMLTMIGLGSLISSIIPVAINHNATTAAGVPRVVYIVFIIIMSLCGWAGLLILPPEKLTRDDGSIVAVNPPRPPLQELKDNLSVFTEWKFLLMIPSFLPAETYLVYSGSANAYNNDLRARCLLSLMSFVFQMPAAYGLQKIFDHTKWNRRKRGLIGLTVVAIPVVACWIWEIIRTKDYHRKVPKTHPVDWSDKEFGWIFVLFMLTWVSCTLWQYVVMYFLGAMSNSPTKLTHYSGCFRGFLGAGEAIAFGLDSIQIPLQKEAGGIFAFYAAGIIAMYYLGWYHIKDTNYFVEEDAGIVIPNHILEQKGVAIDSVHAANPPSVSVEDGVPPAKA